MHTLCLQYHQQLPGGWLLRAYLFRMSYYTHVHRHKGVYIISSPSAAPGKVVPKRLVALRHVRYIVQTQDVSRLVKLTPGEWILGVAKSYYLR